MSKVVKKTALIIAIIVAVCAAIWGIIVAINSFKRESVKVFTVSDIAMTDYWGDTSETYGTVSTDNLQKVLVSDSQTISNIYVKEGQSVSKGDKLLAYDTTLSELDVEKATIELNKLKLQLDNAKKELEELNNTKPSEGGDEGQGGGSGEVLVPPAKLSGSGTEDDPYVYLWGSDSTLDEETKLEMLSGADRAYVVMVEREGNRTDGQVLNAYGICLIKNGEHINISFFQPGLLPDTGDGDTSENDDGNYTEEELIKRKNELKREISNLEVSIKLAELDLQKLKDEVSDSVIYSKVSGTVKAVRDAKEAYESGLPVIEISGGGGYYIEGTLSELELGKVKVGQTVQVNSMYTGMSFDGEITEISQYPAESSGNYGNGNTNVSYYPFKVFVDESANLQESDYVSLSYSSTENSDGLYVEKMFVRTENGKSFVYVRGENGKLEKRWIQTGKDLWGSYIQIRGGITLDDRIAFPYGKDVFDGAKTVEATIDELYS